MHKDDLDERLTLITFSWNDEGCCWPWRAWGQRWCWPWGRSEAAAPREPTPPRWLSEFRCRDAQCWRPVDRAVLLHEIRSAWGSEAAFDDFVRAQMPALLARSKRRFRGGLFWAEVARMFDLVFGD